MESSITGRCNDARSEEMDLTLWFNFDSYYDFGELLSILIILISFPWHEDTPKHNIMSECGRCELSFWSRLASRSISRLIISSNPHISMNGEEMFLLREEGGKPSPAHIVHKSSAYASFTPDLALILTWEPALGLVYILALFPVHSANLAVCSPVFAALLTLARHLDFGHCLWPLLWGHAVTSAQLAIPALVAVSHC